MDDRIFLAQIQKNKSTNEHYKNITPYSNRPIGSRALLNVNWSDPIRESYGYSDLKDQGYIKMTYGRKRM